MTDKPYNITFHKGKSAVLVSIHGPFVFGNIDPDFTEWNRIISSHIETIAVDMSEVNIIDSMGISQLVRISQLSCVNNIRFILIDPAPSVRSIFSSARVDDIFEIITADEFKEIRLEQGLS